MSATRMGMASVSASPARALKNASRMGLYALAVSVMGLGPWQAVSANIGLGGGSVLSSKPSNGAMDGLWVTPGWGGVHNYFSISQVDSRRIRLTAPGQPPTIFTRVAAGVYVYTYRWHGAPGQTTPPPTEHDLHPPTRIRSTIKLDGDVLVFRDEAEFPALPTGRPGSSAQEVGLGDRAAIPTLDQAVAPDMAYFWPRPGVRVSLSIARRLPKQVKRNGRAYIDIPGRRRIGPFDETRYLDDDYIAVRRGRTWRVLGRDGNLASVYAWQNITLLHRGRCAGQTRRGAWQVADVRGFPLSPDTWEALRCREGETIEGRTQTGWKVLDERGRPLVAR